MSQPGIGVIIGLLSGNEESVKAFSRGVGQKIAELRLDDDALYFTFEDGYKLKLFDDGQSCCESRYMRTEDDLQDFIGAVLRSAEVRDCPDAPEDQYGGVHEIQMLVVQTDRGDFVMSNHNEHNGYYGGFLIRAQEVR